MFLALRNIFEHVGGIPGRIVFDNVARVGRRVGDAMCVTETFSAFAAHYGFTHSFCNPHFGHKKGGAENKVSYARDNLLMSLPQSKSADVLNARLLDDCDFSQVIFLDGHGPDDLMSPAFIDAAQNFVFHGQTGCGKTRLATAVGNACECADW